MVSFDVILALSMISVIISPLLIIYYYQYRKYKRHTPNLFYVFLTVFLASIVGGISLFVEEVPFTGGPYSLTAEIAAWLIPFFFFMHFQSLVSLKTPITRYTVVLGLTVLGMTLLVPQYFGLLSRLNVQFSSYYVFIGMIQLVQSVLALYFCVRIAYRNYSISRNTPTQLELAAMILIFLSFPGIATEFIIDNGRWPISTLLLQLITNVPSVFGALGFFLFFINYFRNTDYLYSIPTEVHSIVFYSTAGLPLYRKRIESSNVSEELFSGAFSAIASILEESINENVKLTHIDLGLNNVFFGNVEGVGTLALICDEGSSFFITSIRRFVASLPDRLNELLADGTKVTEELNKLMDLHLLTMFPFLKNKALI